MICPHCGGTIEQEQTVNLLHPVNVNGANPYNLNLMITTVAPIPSQTIAVNTLNAAANGCNPFPQVTYINLGGKV